MKIKAIFCKNCEDTVFSRTIEDLRECSCGSVSVDGGQKYTKFYTTPNAKYKKTNLELDISYETLYDDWYSMIDRYGVIKTSSAQQLVQREAM